MYVTPAPTISRMRATSSRQCLKFVTSRYISLPWVVKPPVSFEWQAAATMMRLVAFARHTSISS
eukprot:scaffold97333_cov96-Phaeocystis_antarctica.AAC.1